MTQDSFGNPQDQQDQQGEDSFAPQGDAPFAGSDAPVAPEQSTDTPFGGEPTGDPLTDPLTDPLGGAQGGEQAEPQAEPSYGESTPEQQESGSYGDAGPAGETEGSFEGSVDGPADSAVPPSFGEQ